ncbi:hypothetical protein KD918_01710 [Acinetobacter baumannii]|uniref:hypothetical protein n=1 Tax=Acinetobacter baumannii TaxID=470 RepID=UPI001B953E20|nr:hypothetical protein [Acinetobacter baumannii]ELT4631730.1 hypothetical protein [Acinetobacter baumannii]MBR8588189.1 hypothetical protein [Acinetobacter baumannii]MCG5789391.1 hypothetical protein [Acinetobacter baumannii]MCJ9443291.1 hypothetical protein [Acinetobacter baumannii]MCO9044638.1 hypothetical protein [Acinetobacter baumannii]
MEVNNAPQNIDKKITCDICDRVSLDSYGILKTVSQKATQEKSEENEIYLCSSCLFSLRAHLRTQKKLLHLFDEN